MLLHLPCPQVYLLDDGNNSVKRAWADGQEGLKYVTGRVREKGGWLWLWLRLCCSSTWRAPAPARPGSQLACTPALPHARC
jgi:hypothetical protein